MPYFSLVTRYSFFFIFALSIPLLSEPVFASDSEELFEVNPASFAIKTFSDIKASDPNAAAIGYVTKMGLMKGFEDGTFKPEQNINRFEFIKNIVEANFSEAEIYSCDLSLYSFPDISLNDKYAPYLCLAKKNGIAIPYKDGTFRGQKPTSFIAFIQMLPKAYYSEASKQKPGIRGKITWGRRQIPFNVRGFQIGFAITRKLAKNVKQFHLNHKITRGEMAHYVFYIITQGEVVFSPPVDPKRNPDRYTEIMQALKERLNMDEIPYPPAASVPDGYRLFRIQNDIENGCLSKDYGYNTCPLEINFVSKKGSFVLKAFSHNDVYVINHIPMGSGFHMGRLPVTEDIAAWHTGISPTEGAYGFFVKPAQIDTVGPGHNYVRFEGSLTKDEFLGMARGMIDTGNLQPKVFTKFYNDNDSEDFLRDDFRDLAFKVSLGYQLFFPLKSLDGYSLRYIDVDTNAVYPMNNPDDNYIQTFYFGNTKKDVNQSNGEVFVATLYPEKFDDFKKELSNMLEGTLITGDKYYLEDNGYFTSMLIQRCKDDIKFFLEISGNKEKAIAFAEYMLKDGNYIIIDTPSPKTPDNEASE